MISKIVDEHINLVRVVNELKPEINNLAEVLINTLKNNNKILIMGNGGSAADSQHMAAELVGRFKKESLGLSAIALSTDSSIITCIANDYSFDEIFSRQVEAIANPRDVVIGISTSGKSKNVHKAMEKAKEVNCTTVSLLGSDGGEIVKSSDLSIVIPAQNTARVQECHILIIHILCELIENRLN